jgi:hypothetical protein
MMRNPFTAIAKKVKAAAQIPGRCARELPLASLRMAREGFWLQRDPYGQPWGPTVTGMPFDKRAGLERAFTVAPGSPLSFFVRCDHYAFVFHQNARAPGRVRRMMMPTPSLGLGLWGVEYKRMAVDFWRQAMRS